MDYKRFQYVKQSTQNFGSFFVKGEKRPRREKEDDKKPGGTGILVVLVAVLSVVLIVSFTYGHVNIKGLLNGSNRGPAISSNLGQSVPTSSSLSLNSKPAAAGSQGLSTEQVADKILPCVVGIVQYQQGTLGETGEGSGIIMSTDGRILTNNHVIDGSNRLEVVMQDGKTYEAKIIGSDTRTDLAVVKIEASGLKFAQFGNSEQCKVGEKVIAVGNPSGLQLAGSVTQGIISALNRNVDVGNGPMNLIQTDAAINPGNSGGALVNMFGQVVGINSAKIAQSGYEGIGFSIPVNTAKPIVDSIIKYGYVKGRVKFGLNCREIDNVTAQINNIPRGIYISFVEPDSSALQNGVKADDIITAIDSVLLKDTDSLIIERDKHKPDDEVTLTIFRRTENKSLQIKVKLIEDKGAAGTTERGDW